MRFYAIHSLKLLNGIKVPNDLAGPGLIRADVAVPGSQERNTGNDRHWGWLSRTAARRTDARRLGSGRHPQLFACEPSQRAQPATNLRFAGRKIRDANIINTLIVAGSTPHRSSIHAACGDFPLPKDRSLIVGIEGVDHA